MFAANENYTGPNKAQTPNFIVQYFEQASALKLAIEQGDVDVAYRNLSPTDLEALKGEADKGVKVVDGAGTEIRYIVFNVKKKPVDNIAVRKAIAQVIDRQAIATNVYKDTVKPLYSTVPAAFPGAKESFKDAFGDPDPAKAKAILEEAGVSTPVTLDGWYTPTHYGPVEVDLWNEIKRQLEATGLFKVNLDSTEWDQYKEEAFVRARTTSTVSAGSRTTRTPTTTSRRSCVTAASSSNGYSNKEVNDALDDGARVRRRGQAPGGLRRRPGRRGPRRSADPDLGGQADRGRPGRRGGRREDVRPGVPVPLLARHQEGVLVV